MRIKLSILSVLILGILLSGCTTVRPSLSDQAKDAEMIQAEVTEEASQSPTTALGNIDEEDMEEYEEPKGVIFAKTDFQGVLKTSYVKLSMFSTQEEGREYQIYIGDKAEQKPLDFDVKTVQPGYFFIELPAGEYNISSVSIPVGSTTATEEIDITFTVVPESITYTGTLNIVGTKERIKLGGVPVIKPGFEYTAEIFDEEQEARAAFEQKYPKVTRKIIKELMILHTKEEEKPL